MKKHGVRSSHEFIDILLDFNISNYFLLQSYPKRSGPARFFFLFSKTIQKPKVMSSEILAVLEYMEKEKGISREDMIATIEGAVKAAAERAINSSGDVRVEISPKTGAMEAWTQLEVVESVADTSGKFIWTRLVCMLKARKSETWWSVRWTLLSWQDCRQDRRAGNQAKTSSIREGAHLR